MKLYLIIASDIDGENLDWFVVAPDVETACSTLVASVEGEVDISERCLILKDVAGTQYEGKSGLVAWEDLFDAS